jgi:hypothetical protein
MEKTRMNTPNQSDSNSRFNGSAVMSLALSVVSLAVYVSVVDRASTTLFVVATGGALTASVVSLVLGLVAAKQMKQGEARLKDRLVVSTSIVAAIGYIVCVGIVTLNILIHWVL